MRPIEVQGSTCAHRVNDNGFIDWFRAPIFVLFSQGRANDELRSLAIGPEPLIHRYSTCMINGFRFKTKELVSKTQNNGVLREKVFYLNNMVDKDWLVVVKTNPRALSNVPEVELDTSWNEDLYQQDEVEDILCVNNHETDIELPLHRDDDEPEFVLRTNDQENEEDDFINENYMDVSDNEESEEELLDATDIEYNDMSC
ncbi:hypothetical protein BC332_14560 [Capsicum chinense]|nr:hypothetical protein BC332_14560 [Capsicum chinense]